jgi:hypothetical protein
LLILEHSEALRKESVFERICQKYKMPPLERLPNLLYKAFLPFGQGVDMGLLSLGPVLNKVISERK